MKRVKNLFRIVGFFFFYIHLFDGVFQDCCMKCLDQPEQGIQSQLGRCVQNSMWSWFLFIFLFIYLQKLANIDSLAMDVVSLNESRIIRVTHLDQDTKKPNAIRTSLNYYYYYFFQKKKKKRLGKEFLLFRSQLLLFWHIIDIFCCLTKYLQASISHGILPLLSGMTST